VTTLLAGVAPLDDASTKQTMPSACNLLELCTS
jgi:hypothetical protein